MSQPASADLGYFLFQVTKLESSPPIEYDGVI